MLLKREVYKDTDKLRRKRSNMRTKLLTIILLIGLNASAQEYLSGFLYTTEVAEEAGLRSRNDVLKLPFFDDFTESNVVPDICK